MASCFCSIFKRKPSSGPTKEKGSSRRSKSIREACKNLSSSTSKKSESLKKGQDSNNGVKKSESLKKDSKDGVKKSESLRKAQDSDDGVKKSESLRKAQNSDDGVKKSESLRKAQDSDVGVKKSESLKKAQDSNDGVKKFESLRKAQDSDDGVNKSESLRKVQDSDDGVKKSESLRKAQDSDVGVKKSESLRKAQDSNDEVGQKSHGEADNFASMIELRKKLMSFRVLVELPPCVGSVTIIELVKDTVKELHKLHPDVVHCISVSDSKEAPMDKVIDELCVAIKSLGKHWMHNDEWMVKSRKDDKDNDDMEKYALDLLDDMINVTRKRMDTMKDRDDNEEMKEDVDSPSSSYGKDSMRSDSDKVRFSPSSTTPTSVLPELPNNKSIKMHPHEAHQDKKSFDLTNNEDNGGLVKLQMEVLVSPSSLESIVGAENVQLIPGSATPSSASSLDRPSISATIQSPPKQVAVLEARQSPSPPSRPGGDADISPLVPLPKASDDILPPSSSSTTTPPPLSEGKGDVETPVAPLPPPPPSMSHPLPPLPSTSSNIVALPPPPPVASTNDMPVALGSPPPAAVAEPGSIPPPPPVESGDAKPVAAGSPPTATTPPPPSTASEDAFPVSLMAGSPPQPPSIASGNAMPVAADSPSPPPALAANTSSPPPMASGSPPPPPMASGSPPPPPASATSTQPPSMPTDNAAPPPPAPTASESIPPPPPMATGDAKPVGPGSPGSLPPLPPPTASSNGSVPPPPPPIVSSDGSVPPPPPIVSSDGPAPPPPPGQQGKGGAPPPPPGALGGKLLRKSVSKLKRSSQMGCLYRQLKSKVEGSSTKPKPLQKKANKVGASGGDGKSMADALAEMTKRSSYFQQIEEDVKNYADSIKEVKTALISFQTKDMDEMVKFHKYVESHLEKLTDETQVLARFEDFPSKKLEGLRMAAALYSKLDTMATTLKNWKIEPPLNRLLDQVENYFNKIKGEVDALDRTKDDEIKKFQSQKIHFDFGILIRIKELMVDVSSGCMELALKEKKEASSKTNGKKMNSGKILWKTFEFAFRVYSFAGGQDERADNLTKELARQIQTDIY